MPLPFVFSATVEAAATVLAAPSSMTWAYRWLRLRNTARRGFSDVPLTFTRTRRCLFARPSLRSMCLIMPRIYSCCSFSALARLACLTPDLLAPIHDALALVRLGRPKLPDVGGHVADGFFLDAGHGELGLVLHLDGDAGGGLELDGV